MLFCSPLFTFEEPWHFLVKKSLLQASKKLLPSLLENFQPHCILTLTFFTAPTEGAVMTRSLVLHLASGMVGSAPPRLHLDGWLTEVGLSIIAKSGTLG